MTVSTFLTPREREYFTSWLCCCLQLRQCNMTTKLIMPAPQARPQHPLLGTFPLSAHERHISPVQDKGGTDWQNPPAASLQVRAQSSQHQRCLSSRLCGTAIMPRIWMSSVRIKQSWSHTRLPFLSAVLRPKTPRLPGPAGSTAGTCQAPGRTAPGSRMACDREEVTRVSTIEWIPSLA